MCGIVGYFGEKNGVPIILQGLKRLEYRGYDSAGLAILKENSLDLVKTKGKVSELVALANGREGKIVIGHTRWSTHGEPNYINAHPHLSMDQSIAIVHNGIIENHSELKKELTEKHNFKFLSETDSEIIAQLIQFFYQGDFEEAFRKMLTKIEGAFGIVALHKNHQQIICARKGSPLVLGVNPNEIFIGSDPTPFLEYTKDVIYLNEKQMAIIDKNGYKIKDFNGFNIDVEIETVPYGIEAIQKQGFEHFMLKEIYEQPDTILNCFRGKINHIENISIKDNNPNRIVLIACGTSFYAALVGKYLIEKTTHIPVIVEQASEFRYRQPMIFTSDLIIALSQSGETADTLEAIRLCKKLHCNVAGIVNVTGSSIAKECNQGIYLHAGPEIGVASTKAFTSQIVALNLLNIFLNKNPYYRLEITEELKQLPEKVKEFLKEQKISSIAEEFKDSKYFLFLGRDINYPVALEGALKLKEISYNPAEGHPAGEMKHGPIALIDENTPVIVILTKDNVYDKVISNMHEVKARKGKIICICDEINEEIRKLSSHIIQVPKTRWEFSPIMNAIPIQLLAYYIAKFNNREIDQPRNLAKAVSVE